MKGKYSFQVIFSKKLETINIFVKYNITEFNYVTNEGFECIYFIYEINKPGNIFISPNEIKGDCILYKVASYFNNGKRQCHECIKNYFMQFNTCSVQRDRSIMISEFDIRDIMAFCPAKWRKKIHQKSHLLT